jgi:endo-1,4-beta-xylanase
MLLNHNASRRKFILGALVGWSCAPQFLNAEMIKSLAHTATQKGVSFGCAINERAMSIPKYLALIKSHCRIIVPEISLKWHVYEPTPGFYNFSAADEVVRFVLHSNLTLRGHTLIWHECIPDWAAQSTDFKDVVYRQMAGVMGRYKGSVSSWDVVNEALEPMHGRDDGLRKSLYLEVLGEGYIEWAFRTARQFDDSAQLVYNDYGCEGNEPWNLARRGAYLQLVRSLLDKSAPIDAVGFQAHLKTHMSFDGRSWARYLAEFRRLGLKILITELDVNDRASPSDITIRDQEVADLYKRFLDATLSEPAVTAVLTWGLTDASTWIRSIPSADFIRSDGLPQRPLPYDDLYQPKKAAESIQRALANASR